MNGTKEMATLKDTIYQAGFELGLEKAQIPIGYELNKLKVVCPNDVFCTIPETTYGVQVASTEEDDEQNEDRLNSKPR